MALATPPPGFLPTDRTEGSTPFEFATQLQSPDIQAQEGCSGSRSLSHSRREHRCWLEIFRNTELIYWTNFPFHSLNFKFYRACHSGVFSPLEKKTGECERLSSVNWFPVEFCDRWLNNRIIFYISIERDQGVRREQCEREGDQVDFLK